MPPQQQFLVLDQIINLLEDHQFKFLERFIKRTNFDVDTIGTDSGIAAIHYAAGMRDEAVAIQGTTALLQFKANVNIATKYDLVTPLHIAVENNYPNLMRLLLLNGGDLEVKNIEEETPISLAIGMKRQELIDIIVQHIKAKKSQAKRVLAGGREKDLLFGNKLTPSKRLLSLGPETPNSPYFVTLHKKLSPKGSDVIEISDSDDDEGILEQSFFMRKRDTNCIRANLFELTKDNLDQFTRSVEITTKNRKSLISKWCQNIRGRIRPTVFQKNIQEIEKVLAGFPDDTHYESAIEEEVVSHYSHVPLPDFEIPEIRITSPDTSVPPQSIHLIDDEGIVEEIPIIEVPESVKDTSQIEILDDSNFIRSPRDHQDSIVQLVEEYEHRDPEMGMRFYELKLVANSRLSSASVNKIINLVEDDGSKSPNDSQSTITSTAFSVPLDYDTDTLREELKSFGFIPGPITKSTKRLYLRKLFRYKKRPPTIVDNDDSLVKNFSLELQRTLKPDIQEKLIREYATLEKEMEANIRNSDKQWRQGNAKKSFVYFLIDPRISQNLPGVAHSMESHQIWRQFLSSIFYVGKGKSSRPFAHLYEAMELHRVQSEKCPEKTKDRKKVDRILEIWKTQYGVVCLQTFHNIIPAEAFTREGAIIEAMNIRSLTNLKGGEFYGIAQGWPNKKRKCLGIYLLFKALKIFLEEGESQISPENL